GDLAGARTMGAFEARADAKMEPDTMADRDAGVQDVAIHRMNESVPTRDRPVGPLGDTHRAKKLPAAREPIAALLAVVCAHSIDGAERRRELRARDAPDGEHGLLVRREPVDLLLDHLPERIGDPRGHAFHGDRERPLAVDAPDVFLRD